MKVSKIVLAGLVAGVFRFVWRWLNRAWLFSWVYTLEPTLIWKRPEQISFVVMSITDVVFAFLLSFVYALIHKGVPGKGIVKGFWFGLCVWLVGSLPGNFSLGLISIIAPGVVVYWIINYLVVSLSQGVIISAIYGSDSR